MGKMKNSTIAWIIVGAVVLILLLWFVGAYNNFVSLSQNVDSKWSQVENDYQVQADKIPNFASTITSQVGVETKFVKDVIAARTAFKDAQGQAQIDAAGQQMNNGITTLVNAVAENYPVLQASTGYTQLRDELSASQNKIGNSRRLYIEAIQDYNTATKRFPSNIIAGIFGFSGKDYYKAAAGTNTPVLGNGTLP
ncbi:MAG: LemA family protein [archaeon]